MKILLALIIAIHSLACFGWNIEKEGFPLVPTNHKDLVIHRHKPSGVKWVISLQKLENKEIKDFSFDDTGIQFFGKMKCELVGPEISYITDQHVRYRMATCFPPKDSPAIILTARCDSNKKQSKELWEHKLKDGRMFLSCI